MIDMSIVEMFRLIVERTSESIDHSSGLTLLQRLQLVAPKIQSIRYEHGHPLELIETMRERSQSPTGKFDMWPCIMLFTDFDETAPVRPISYRQTVMLQIVIAYCTSPSMKAAERDTEVFTPILRPIYEEFITQIYKSTFFVVYSRKQIQHKKIDRYYWGKTGLYGNAGNTFNDYIDAIEIQNLTLKVNY